MRRGPLLLTATLVAVLTLMLPVASSTEIASAADRPDRVGLVSFTGASLTNAGATLTVVWPAVKGAESYEVFASRDFDKAVVASRPVARVTGTSATIRGLTAGSDYYVAVRATWTDAAGRVIPGPPSGRVGHSTISKQASMPASAAKLSVLTWNACSNACANTATRMSVINRRIGEVEPGIVALQEASRYTEAPAGYRFAFDGQNDILYRTAEYKPVAAKKGKPASGLTRFASAKATAGKGIAWSALRHSSGEYVVVLNAHLVAGTSAKAVAQRQYEAGRLAPFASSILTRLAASHGSLTDWKKARVVIAGDFNTHKSRLGDKTMAILEKAGWFDAYDEAARLTRQHFNSANPTWSTKPVIGERWGDHVDKVLVRPSRSVVYSWENIGKMSGGKFTAPLGSDHHPVKVVLSTR